MVREFDGERAVGGRGEDDRRLSLGFLDGVWKVVSSSLFLFFVVSWGSSSGFCLVVSRGEEGEGKEGGNKQCYLDLSEFRF